MTAKSDSDLPYPECQRINCLRSFFHRFPIRTLRIRVKQLKQLGRYLLESSLHAFRILAVGITVVAAYIALKRVFVWKLLLYFSSMFQSFVISLNQVRSINAASDCLRKLIELEQTRLCKIKDPVQTRVSRFMLLQECFQLFPGL